MALYKNFSQEVRYMAQANATHGLPPEVSNRLDAAMFSSQPLQAVLDLVLDSALELSQAQYGSLRWLNRRKNVLELKAMRIASDTPAHEEANLKDLPLSTATITTVVVKQRRPQRIADLRQASLPYSPIVSGIDMRSELAVPLWSNDGDVVVGVLNVESREPEAFTTAHQDMLCALAQRAQIVVKRATLSEALKNLGQKALTGDLDALLDYTVEALADLLDVGVCSLWLLDPLTDELILEKATRRPTKDRQARALHVPRQGFLGRALKARTKEELVYASNVQVEEDFLYRKYAKRQGWRSALVAPIRSSDADPLGVISMYAVDEERHFTDYDRSLAIAFANQVAMALQQARLLADNARRIAVETSLQRVHDALATARDFHGLLQPCVEETMRLAHASGAVLYLRDEDTRENVVAAVAGIAERVQGMRTPLEGSLSGWVALQNKADLCAVDDARVDRRIAGLMGLRGNVAAAPLALQGKVIGTLVVLNKQHGTAAFTETDLRLLQTLATQATLAIEKARLYEASEQYTRRDRVMHDILQASMSCNEIDDLLMQAATGLHEAFGYKVSLCLVEQGELVFKATKFYDGKDRWNEPVFKLTRGITGLVARSGQARAVPDVNKTALPYYPGFPDTRSELVLPLMTRDQRTIGVLDFESREVNVFSEQDIPTFAPIASGITLAIENMQRLKEHATLRRIAEVVSQAQEFSHMLDTIVPTVVELFQVNVCSIYLGDTKGEGITLVRHQGLAEEVAARMCKMRTGQGIAGKVYQNGAPRVVRDLVLDPDAEGGIREGDGLRSMMSIPIRGHTKTLGVLNVLTASSRFFTDHDMALLDLIGNQIGRALERDESSQQYRRLYEEASDLMFTIDPEGRILDANHQAKKRTGYAREELRGTILMDLIADKDVAALGHERVKALPREGHLPLFPVEIRSKDGTRFWVESNLTPIYDQRKELVAIEAVWRDITERQHRTQQLNALLALSRSAGDTSGHNDLLLQVAQGSIQLLKSARCIVHLVRDNTEDMEVITFPLAKIPSPSCTKASCANNARICNAVERKKGGIFNNLKKMRVSAQKLPRAFGDSVHHAMIMPIKTHEHVFGVISVVRDEEQAPPYNRNNQDYLELLANILSLDLEHKRLVAMQAKQQAALTTLEQVGTVGGFLAHKVPNVLGTIPWTAQQLAELLPRTTPAIQQLMENLLDSSHKARRLITQCRSLAKPLCQVPEIVALAPLVQTVLGQITFPPSIQVHLEPRALPAVKVNAALLTEVIEGVVHNALDAMPDGGELFMHGTVANHVVQLHVRDTGGGIAPEHLPHLFVTPFFTTKAEGDGLGLGLWLSRLYLHSVGGDIHLTETSSTGTTFTLSLPVSADVRPEPLRIRPDKERQRSTFLSHGAVPGHGAAQVLIVEDDSNWQGRLSLPFIDQGWEVHRASSYDEAMRLLNRRVT